MTGYPTGTCCGGLSVQLRATNSATAKSDGYCSVVHRKEAWAELDFKPDEVRTLP
jgi:hypothetical protein